MCPMSNSESRKRLAEDRAAMSIDPNPPGVAQRPFTDAEAAALDGAAVSSIDAETLGTWSMDATENVSTCCADVGKCHCPPRGWKDQRILRLIAALRDMTDSRQEARNEHRAAVAERNDLRATLAAVRAWADDPHGARSELLRALGDE